MSPFRRRLSRAASIVGASALWTCLVLPGSASAVVGSTIVDHPAPDAVLEFQGPAQAPAAPDETKLAVAGTAVGAQAGETVDVICTYGIRGRAGRRRAEPLAEDVPIGPDGRFSVSARVPRTPCRVRAVPANFELPDGDGATGDEDVASYAGPRVLGGAFEQRAFPPDAYTPGVPVNDSVVFTRSQRRGTMTVEGLSAAAAGGNPVSPSWDTSGLAQAYYVEDTRLRSVLQYAGRLKYLSVYDSDQQKPIIVDGRDATVAGTALPGERVVLVSRHLDPITGDLAIVERAPIAFITEDHSVYTLQPAGLEIERTTVQDRDGRRISFRDVYRSTDGLPHRVSLQYINGTTRWTNSDALFRISWVTGDEYRLMEGDPRFGPGPDGPGTMYAHIPPDPITPPEQRRADHPGTGGEAAFSFDPTPTLVRFYGDHDFAARWVRDVPAGGSWTLSHRYAQATTRAELDQVLGSDPEPPVPTGPTVPENPGSGPSDTPSGPSGEPTPGVPPSLLPPPSPRAEAADPTTTLAAEVRRALTRRPQALRLAKGGTVRLQLRGMPAGRYGVTVRRGSRRGASIAAGATTLRAPGPVGIGVRLTAAGRRWFAGKAGRGRRVLKAVVTVSWTPKGETTTRTRASRYAVRVR